MRKTLTISLVLLAGAMYLIAPPTLFARGGRAVKMAEPAVSDSLGGVYNYTEAIKRLVIYGDTLSAERLSLAALERDSAYAPAHALLARLQGARNPQRALHHARKAYMADTADVHNLESLARATVMTGDYPEAAALYERLIRRTAEPDHFRVLAMLYQGMERPYVALATLDSAEMKVGRNPVFSQLKQQLYLSTRQTEKAEAEARLLVAEMPYMAETHVALADIYAATGRDSLAHASYLQAIALDTTAVMPHAALGDFYHRRNRTADYLNIMGWLFSSPAVPLEEKVSQFGTLTSNIRFYRDNYVQINGLVNTLAILYPQSREVADLRINHLIASGEVEQAVGVLKHFLDETPAPAAEDFLQIIMMENHLGHRDSAAVYTDRALELYPGNIDLWAQRGHTRQLADDWNGAAEAYREALRHADEAAERSVLWGYIGDAEYRTGNMKGCYRAFDKALKYDADNSSVLNNYAYFLAMEGRDLDRALVMAERACSLSTANPTFLDTLAWVLYGLGRYDEAKKHMQQALSLDRANSPELALHYGDILDALGEHFMARTYWRRALERGAEADVIERRLEGQKTEKQTEQ